MKSLARHLVAWGTFAALFLALADQSDAQIFRRRARQYVPSPEPVIPVQPVQPVPVQPVPVQPRTPTVVEEQVQVDVPVAKVGPARRLSYFLNTPVRLQGNATAGQVSDFVLNSQGGIDYVVISNNGQYMLVPYSSARFDWDQRYMGLDMNRGRFDQIPTFTQAQWGTVVTPQSDYMRRMNTFWGVNVNTPGGSGVNIKGGLRGTVPGKNSGTTPGSQVPRAPGAVPGTNPADPLTPAPGKSSPGPVVPAPGSPINPSQPVQPTIPGNPGTVPGNPQPNPATPPATPGRP